MISIRERFLVYVVIPMWLEGILESENVQEIIHSTWETLATMYGLIRQAIKETWVTSHPREYLNFFCLVNREEKRGEFVHQLSLHCSTSS